MPLLSEHHAHGGELPAQRHGAAAPRFSGKTGGGVPTVRLDLPSRAGGRARLRVSTVSAGGKVRDLGVARQVPPRRFVHQATCGTRRTKQKGAFRSKEEKDITLLLNASFSLPSWEVYLMQVQGNSISQTAADLGF